MIVHIPEEDFGRFMQEGAIGTGEAIRRFPKRPHGPTKKKQLPLEGVNFPQRVRLRISHHFLLQQLNLLAQRFQDQKVLVDDRIHQGVQHIVGAALPHAAFAAPQSFPYRLEDVGSVLLK